MKGRDCDVSIVLLYNFGVIEKLVSACYFQIALEAMLLPLLIAPIFIQSDYRKQISK